VVVTLIRSTIAVVVAMVVVPFVTVAALGLLRFYSDA
jgi:hypothetical protein